MIKIIITTALTANSSNNPTSKPIKVTASVAAACGVDSPNIVNPSAVVSLKMNFVIPAAINLPTTTIAVNNKVMTQTSKLIKTPTSTNIPTEIKKKGIKRAFPTN